MRKRVVVDVGAVRRARPLDPLFRTVDQIQRSAGAFSFVWADPIELAVPRISLRTPSVSVRIPSIGVAIPAMDLRLPSWPRVRRY